MSEEMEQILPEQEENKEVLLDDNSVVNEVPEQESSITEVIPPEEGMKELGDWADPEAEAYKESVTSRGYDFDEKATEEDLLNLMFKISDHPNGDRHATNLINNYYKEQGDFRDGGIFENVDVANLLNPLKEVYPDVKTISDGDEKPRPVSVSAEKIKDFLSKEWNRREYPVETFGMDAVSATGQTFK